MTICVTGQPYTKAMGEIYVKVEPNSEEFEFKNGKIPEIKLTEPAENGRANSALKSRIRELTGEKIGIVSGHKSRRKKIRFQISEQKFREKLG